MTRVLEMSGVQEIERAVANLKPEEMTRFREWFEQFDSELWDRQFERDAKSGKLDRVAEKSITEYKKGNAKPL